MKANPDSGTFEHRGLVEGFYGPPYRHSDRLWLLERLGSWGMNRYVYAPKDDPLHRSEWREAYPRETWQEFRELVAAGERAGVAMGFALSPGLSISYADRGDRSALCQKLGSFRDLGSRFLCLALDDVPTQLAHAADQRQFSSLAQAHLALAHELAESLGEDTTLWLVPTDYMGVESTAYLEELGEQLDPRIEVGWTGRTVVSPTIRQREAAARAATLRRRLLLWDNVPVADGLMRCMLHLGAYSGRDPALPQHVSGALLNPMQHAHASGMTLRCAADYLLDPAGYDPERAWRDAAQDLGAGAAEAFALFGAAHCFSALSPERRDPELEERIHAVRDGSQAPASLGPLLETRLAAAGSLREHLADTELLREIEPWISAHHDETRRMQAAADLLVALASDADALARGIAFVVMQGRLTQTPVPPVVSYGPRRAAYPQFRCLQNDDTGFGGDPVLFRERNLAEELVRFAEERGLEALGGASQG